MEEYKVQATIVAGFDASQAKKELNNFTDDIQAQKQRLSSDKGIVLASNLAELRLKAKELSQELKRATSDQTKLDIQTNLEVVKKQITDANRQFTNFVRTGDEAQSVLGKNFAQIDGSINKTKGNLEGLGQVLVSLGITAVINNIASSVLKVAASFQTYNSILTNALGSQEEARISFELLKSVAAETPFSLDQITQSYIKLVNRGFKPTRDEITKLGDLASSQGKSFDQLAEAVLDAQTNEFERLKEFGIRAKQSGDEVSFTFKGVETTVKKTDTAIRDYLLSLGTLDGVQGAMASQSATFNGAISNLGDALTNTAATLGSVFLPILTPLIRFVSDIVTSIGSWIEQNKVLVGVLSVLTLGLGGYVAIAPFVTAANLAIVASFLPLLSTFGLIIAGLVLVNEAYQSNFLGFKDFVDGVVQEAKVWYEFFRIVFTNIGKLRDGLTTTISNAVKSIRSSFSGLSVITGVVGSIFQGVFNEVKRRIRPIIDLINFLKKTIASIPGVGAAFKQARINATDQIQFGPVAPQSPFGVSSSSTSLPDLPTPSIGRSGGGGGGKSKQQEEQDKALEENIKKEKEAFDKKKKNAKEYIDEFNKIVKEGEKSLDDIVKKIDSASKALESLNAKQVSEQEKLADKYLEIQGKLSGQIELGATDSTAKLQEDLALILQYTTEAQRAEAQRQSTLSETQKIVEGIQAIEEEKKGIEEQIAELEKQKERESVILEAFNVLRDQLEKQYTKVVENESNARVNILQREIERSRELIRLQQELGAISSGGGGGGGNTSTTANTTNNVDIQVSGTGNPEQVAREIVRRVRNFNSGQNL